MKKLFLIGILFFLGVQNFAQNINCKEDLFPIRDPQKKQFGYVNIFGEWRIIPFYDQAREFKEGIAVVNRKSKFGLIDCNARVLLTCDYDNILDFENGYAWVEKDGLWGMVNRAGKFVLECKYEAVENISKFYDLAWLKTTGKWGVFDKENGIFIHEPQFDSYLQLSHDYSLVEVAGKKGMIAHAKKTKVLEMQYTSIDKFAPYLMSYQLGDKLGVIRDNGRILAAPIYTSVKNLGLTLFAAKKGEKFGVFDVWGRQLVPFVLDSIGVFVNDAAPIKIGNDYGFINNRGQRILGRFDSVTSFDDGVTMVKDTLGFQVMTRKGERIGAIYEEVKLYDDYFAGKKEGSWEVHLLSSSPNPSYKFEAVYGGISNKIRVKTMKGMRLYNVYAGDYYSDIVFDSIADWNGNFAYVYQKNKIGLIDSMAQVVVEPYCESIIEEYWYGKKYFKTTRNGMKYLIDSKGKSSYAPHHTISKAGDKLYVICDNGKCGLIDAKEKYYIEQKYDQLYSPDSLEVKYAFPLIAVQKGKYCLVDSKDEQIVKPKYSDIQYLGEGKFELYKKGEKTIVNHKGEPIH